MYTIKKRFNTSYSCGTNVLAYLLGKEPRYWAKQLIQYRKTHSLAKDETWESSFWWRDDEITYYSELRGLLRLHRNWRLRFMSVRNEPILKYFVHTLKPNTTYLIGCELHFTIVQNCHIWDSRNDGERVELATYSCDIVEAVAILPRHKIVREWPKDTLITPINTQSTCNYRYVCSIYGTEGANAAW